MITQDMMKDVYAGIKSGEKIYRKKDLYFDYRVADKEEEILTVINKKVETKNAAKPGDYILTGSMGEQYVLPANKFESRYFIVENKAKTKPVEIKAKIYKGPPISFQTNWGEEMILEGEDSLVDNSGEYYRIDANAFLNTYELIKE
jgi:hypothetical protein